MITFTFIVRMFQLVETPTFNLEYLNVGLMGACGGLMGACGGLMGACGGLIEACGGLMGACGGLMGACGGLNGVYWCLWGFESMETNGSSAFHA